MKNQVKYLRQLFYELLNDYGRVYITVRYSQNTTIGERGFTEEEQSKGLVLVFTRSNCRKLEWTEDGGILATLGFGIRNKPERCSIHPEDIISVFSADAKVRFQRWDWLGEDETHDADGSGLKENVVHDEKIVSLDAFRKPKI